MKPENDDFSFQVELFCRKPDLVSLEEPAHLTPIPVDDDLSSLSAILLNDHYYNYMRDRSELVDGLRRATLEALVCLKAKAYLEIKVRVENGKEGERKHLKKHKGDVFRLGALLPENTVFDIPEEIQKDLNAFAAEVKIEMPGKELFKELGAGSLEPEKVFEQVVKSFGIAVG